MQTEGTIQQITQQLQRPINCLLDANRNIRKQGLTSIQSILFTKSHELIVQVLNNTKLYKNLCFVVDDSIQKHREIALKLIDKCLTLKENQSHEINKDIIEMFLKTLINRINTTPFAQTCQQLRLQIIKIFKLFLQFPQAIVSNISEFSSAISKCLGDSFPDLKKVYYFQQISSHSVLKYKIGYTSDNIVKSLANNLGHQHAAVRKLSIEALGNLLITERCGQNYKYVNQAIFGSSFNKSTQVRRATYECVSKLINYFSLKLLETFQGNLVAILLNGLSDESPQIVSLTKKLLQQCGQKLLQSTNQNEQKPILMQIQSNP